MTTRTLDFPMSMIPLYVHCREVASREFRTMIVHENASKIPAGRYVFVECYCDDPECDCRRVFIQVYLRPDAKRIVLLLNYGWETPKYYQGYMVWSAKLTRRIAAGCLDPLSPRPPYAATFLRLFREHALNDAYRTRLNRHYTLFKASLRRN